MYAGPNAATQPLLKIGINTMKYDLSLLKNAVWEVQAQVQSPLDMCLASALFAMCASTDPLINVESPSGGTSCVSLFITTIAESGERKSATDKKFTQFIRRHEATLKDLDKKSAPHTEGISTETLMKVWKSKEKKILKELEKYDLDDHDGISELTQVLERHLSNKPEKIEKLILIEDTTTEALLYNLGQGNKNLCLSSDEGGIVLERRSAKDITHLNKIWDGSTTSVQRVSKPSYSIVDARLTISIMVQNQYFMRFARRSDGIARNSGYFARNLIFTPVSTQGTRFLNPGSTSEYWLNKFGKRMIELLEQGPNQAERITMKFAPEARQIWLDFYHEVERRIGENGYCSDINDFASKITNNMSRIAAIVHYFCKDDSLIDVESINFARDLCIILIDNFKNTLGDGCDAWLQEQRVYELHKWLYKESQKFSFTPGVTKTRLRQYGPNELRNSKKLEEAVFLLQKRGLANLITSPSGGNVIALKTNGFHLIEPIAPKRIFDIRWQQLLNGSAVRESC